MVLPHLFAGRLAAVLPPLLRGLAAVSKWGVSSSPVHRAFVLVLGANIAVLLDCSKSSRQCSLSYLLTYCLAAGQRD